MPVKLHAFEVMAGVKSKAVDATPFTVVVKLVPLNEVALVLIMFAPDDATPFTVDVKVLADDDKALVLIILTPVPATPFTVVVKVLVEEEFETLFTAGALAETPFTVDVMVFTEEVKVLVVVGIPQLNVPLPLVVKACPLVPSTAGKV